MRKLQIVMCILFSQNIVFGDLIIANYHFVNRCVKIENIDSYPNIAILGAYHGPTTPETELYEANKDSCLVKGYKFNKFKLIWTTRKYLDSVGIGNIPVDQLDLLKKKKQALATAPVYLLSDSIEPYGITVPDSNPLISEKMFYRITGNEPQLHIELHRVVKSFFNKSDSVIEYGIPAASSLNKQVTTITPDPKLIVIKRQIIVIPHISGSLHASIINSAGKEIFSYSRYAFSTNPLILPCKGLVPGFYHMSISINNDKKIKQFTIIN